MSHEHSRPDYVFVYHEDGENRPTVTCRPYDEQAAYGAAEASEPTRSPLHEQPDNRGGDGAASENPGHAQRDLSDNREEWASDTSGGGRPSVGPIVPGSDDSDGAPTIVPALFALCAVPELDEDEDEREGDDTSMLPPVERLSSDALGALRHEEIMGWGMAWPDRAYFHGRRSPESERTWSGSFRSAERARDIVSLICPVRLVYI